MQVGTNVGLGAFGVPCRLTFIKSQPSAVLPLKFGGDEGIARAITTPLSPKNKNKQATTSNNHNHNHKNTSQKKTAPALAPAPNSRVGLT